MTYVTIWMYLALTEVNIKISDSQKKKYHQNPQF